MAFFAKANTAIIAVMKFKGQFWLEICQDLNDTVTSLSMTKGMQMMGTIKLSGRAVAVYRHAVYQTISITIPNYNIGSIHPAMPYNGFIWWEKTFVNFMFLWRIMLFTNTIRNRFRIYTATSL